MANLLHNPLSQTTSPSTLPEQLDGQLKNASGTKLERIVYHVLLFPSFLLHLGHPRTTVLPRTKLLLRTRSMCETFLFIFLRRIKQMSKREGTEGTNL